MTLVQLKHFISLAQTASFAKSAAALHLTPFGRQAVERARELVLGADDLRDSARLAGEGQQGVLRIGLGSGPGAMLMTPLLLKMAQEKPQWQVTIARASTELLVQALRDRALDALVIDARSLRPAPDLSAQFLHEMAGAFMVRHGHALAKRTAATSFDEVLRYPIAATPLSDEVARILVDRYGPRAHPDLCVSLRCDEIPSLVDVARNSDAVVLAIRAAAPDLMELTMKPALAATARFGLVTLRRRTSPPALELVRSLMAELLVDTGRSHRPRRP
jgi:DNA-binding transcriptional LysR family regulator